MNSDSFKPNNDYKHDERVSKIDPRKKPITPMTGTLVRGMFRSYATIFTKVIDRSFKRSGNVEGGSKADESDLFLEAIDDVFPSETYSFKCLLLYAFLIFDGVWPKSLAKQMLCEYQFDSHSEDLKSKTISEGKKREL